MTKQFIAGKDASQYDKSDWAIDEIPVYFNPANMPPTARAEDIEELIRLSCESWSIRYIKPLIYKGRTNSTVIHNAVVINYQTSQQLAAWYKSEVNGLCRYHSRNYSTTNKWTLDACEIYINADNRPFADNFAHGTIKHELGHACGIHGHHPKYGNVMSTSSMGRYKLTLEDCQMLDSWNSYTVELHKDYSMSVPVVTLGNGETVWIDLKYTGNPFSHVWEIDKEVPWSAHDAKNVTLGGLKEYAGVMCQEIKIKDIAGNGYTTLRADFVFAPNGKLILEYAE